MTIEIELVREGRVILQRYSDPLSMNEIAANTAGIIRIITEYFKGNTIKTIQSILGPEPKKPLLILHAGDHRIIG